MADEGNVPYPVAVVDDKGAQQVFAAETTALTLPTGQSSQRPSPPINGQIRYNSQTNVAEAYINGSWVTLLAGTLDKAAVGLGNVDNTADASKPISTAMQTALNVKKVINVGSFITNTRSVTASAAVIPTDDTIPQITEGFEVMSYAYTPIGVGNLLDIDVEVNLGFSGGFGGGIFGLFVASQNDALQSRFWYSTDGQAYPFMLRHTGLAVPSAAAMTFSVRIGAINAGKTLSFNRSPGSDQLGQSIQSSIRIIERLP